MQIFFIVTFVKYEHLFEDLKHLSVRNMEKTKKSWKGQILYQMSNINLVCPASGFEQTHLGLVLISKR